MKKIIAFTLIICVIASAVPQESTVPQEKVEYIYPKEVNPINAFTRGVVNTFTFWLEVPRNLILDVNKYPFFGLLTGSLKGLYFSGARVCLSVADVFMLGATGPSAYNPDIFPEYVWNSRWNPYALTNLPPEYAIMKAEADVRESDTENMDESY